jgi:hypothetical protein
MRKDSPFARQEGRLGTVLTIEAAKIQFTALAPPGIEVGIGTEGPAAKR